MDARRYVHFFCITLLHTYVLLDVNILYMYRGLLFDVLDEFPLFQETSLEIIVVLHKAPTFRGHDDDDWSTMGGTAHIRREAKANREADKASLAAQKPRKQRKMRDTRIRKSRSTKRDKKETRRWNATTRLPLGKQRTDDWQS